PPDDVLIPGPPPAPGIAIAKFADLDDANGNGFADAGEQIVYSFRVANTGNVTLVDVAVVDSKISGLIPAPLDQLAPGVTAVVVAGAYTVTSGEMTGAPLINVAHAVGTLPDGSTVIESDDDDVELPTQTLGMASTGVEPVPAAALGL